MIPVETNTGMHTDNEIPASNEYISPEEHKNIVLASAPGGMMFADLYMRLSMDPHQTRLSPHPVVLKHPRTGKIAVLKEFAEDIVGDARFGIVCEDAVAFISRVQMARSEEADSLCEDLPSSNVMFVITRAYRRRDRQVMSGEEAARFTPGTILEP
jgi:hypothetical protein